ncbi:hypothetical protein, partial [Thomasclavelia cocleata]|uniref:hypothetical protein n=1 Tax=Thomasclavelia cocleata TaxID=69824 RepID=UPI0024324722
YKEKEINNKSKTKKGGIRTLKLVFIPSFVNSLKYLYINIYPNLFCTHYIDKLELLLLPLVSIFNYIKNKIYSNYN